VTDGLLSGMRVLDISDTVGAAYCTRLLAGLGADVVLGEHPDRVGGLRAMGPFPAAHGDDPEWSAAHLYFNAGKRSITLDIEKPAERDRLLALLPQFDVLVDSLTEQRAAALELTPPRLRAARPGLTIVSVTPWGRTGPRADRQGDELTVQALSGFASLHGEPPREPLRLPGWQMECFAGTYAAIGVLGALLDGGGRTFDVGVLEAAICAMESRLSSWEYTKKTPKRRLASFDGFYPLNIWECAEGSVVMPFYAPRDWEGLAIALGDEDLQTGDAFRTNNRRVRNRAAVTEKLAPLLARRTAREIFDITMELRSSLGMVMDAASLMDDPQVRARSAIVEVEHPVVGRYAMPSAPFLTSEGGWRNAPAPLLGEHNEAFAKEDAVGRTAPVKKPVQFQPLSGIRVLDLTTAWAGPSATRVLGALGADVLKIEACTWYDAWRGPSTPPPPGIGNYADNDPGTKPHERTPLFGTANRNKRGISLDLSKEAGRGVFHELVGKSDVVLSNFSARVLPNLELDYGHLRAIKDDIIVVSMPGYGLSGPYRHAVAYGNTMEAMSGLSARFGYADGPPQITHDLTYGDPVAGAHAAFAVMAALAFRKRTGRGLSIDASQHETLLAQGGEAIVKYSIDGELLPRLGSMDHTHAPQGYVPCAGDDQWIAIAVDSETSWAALRTVVADPVLDDLRFTGDPGRRKHAEELASILATHTATRDKHALAEELGSAGVPAAPVLTYDEVVADPQVLARQAFEDVTHPEAGRRRLPRVPISVDGQPVLTRRHTPLFAQHNREVFADLLGMNDEALAALTAAGVIGDAPVTRTA
jgi:crotonobetainyl-CoA:carnitine CoA-transferase CaiB-like acyl-CoA transferase